LYFFQSHRFHPTNALLFYSSHLSPSHYSPNLDEDNEDNKKTEYTEDNEKTEDTEDNKKTEDTEDNKKTEDNEDDELSTMKTKKGWCSGRVYIKKMATKIKVNHFYIFISRDYNSEIFLTW
jgi:hypothetical protein